MSRLPRRLVSAGLAVLLAPLAALPLSAQTINAKFTCADGKSIDVTFAGDKATLVLSDGRTLTLAAGPSAGGARYASANDAEVFWNVGNTGRLEEGGKETYSNCVTP